MRLLTIAGVAWVVLVADAPPDEKQQSEKLSIMRALECVIQAEHVELKEIKGGDRSRDAIIKRIVAFCTEIIAEENPTLDRAALQRTLTKFANDHFDDVASGR